LCCGALLAVSTYLVEAPLAALTLLAMPLMLHHAKPLKAVLVKLIGFPLGWDA